MHNKMALILQGSIWTYRGFPSWKKGALAAAATLALLGAHPDAYALALGAAQVKSALGEPLRAEVEVPEITSEEAASFQAALGTPQEFEAAGVDYSPAVRGMRITLNHRANGQAYLSMQGQQPVNEPFLTIVIDASWSKGRVVRDYTLLIDPPRPPAVASAAAPSRRESAPVVTSAPPRRAAVSSPRAETPPAPAPAPSAPSPTPGGEGQQVHVQRGDTATSILETYPVENVSLDQMLVALLRANPRAFIHGNVNLIRAGAVVSLPSAEEAAAVPPASAHRMLIAQSHDFRTYRQGLATTAGHSGHIAANSRSATGQVQPQVQETGAAPPPPDRLKLSRGQATGASESAATRLAQSRQAQEQAARQAELNRNIKELSQLAKASGTATAAAPAPAASAAARPAVPAINVPAPTAVATAASAKVAASAPVAATQPTASAAAAASAPVSATPVSAAASQPKPAVRPRPAPPPSSGPSFLDTLLDNWLAIVGALAVILLLGGYGFYRSQQKRGGRGETRLGSSDLPVDSKLPPDSYFGASGGQRVDTHDGGSTGASSSMAYSPSQLEAVGDVDPVSEADVYLAYGRDAQAEEILKEALRTFPGRTSIYAKLAEIYAKQHDARQLEAIATEARRVTHGEGREWQAIVNLGHQIDPANPLYASDHAAVAPVPPVAPPPPSATHRTPDHADPSPVSQNSLDLDLTGPAPLLVEPAPPPAGRPTAPGGLPSYAETVPASIPVPLGATTATGPAPLRADNINFTPPAQPQTPSNSGMMEFDANTFAAPTAPSPLQTKAKPADEDPLATKLALAQEFRAIGDNNSARTLVKEVLAAATGTLKTKAQQFLNDLG